MEQTKSIMAKCKFYSEYFCNHYGNGLCRFAEEMFGDLPQSCNHIDDFENCTCFEPIEDKKESDDFVDKPYNIFTLDKGEVIQLNDDYVLEKLCMALVSNYPDKLYVNNVIIGNGKSTCKELIKEKAKRDLIDIENQLKELTEAVNKLKEILGE